MADSRREQIAKAFEEAERDAEDSNATPDLEESLGAGDESLEPDKTPSGDSVDESPDSGEQTPEGGKEKPRGADGKFVSKGAKGESGSAASKLGKPDLREGAQGGKAEGKAAQTPTPEAPPEEIAPAPKAWRPAVREHWGKLPTDVREEITRRETEITQFIGQHGVAIQQKRQFDEVVHPYLPLIAAQQSTPIKAVANLMNTAARLTLGNPQQKASIIAEIVRNYGVDLKELDAVLAGTGNAPTVASRQETVPSWAQPMVQFMNETQQSRQREQQRIEQAANAELEQFKKKPFFEDLSEDIGMLLGHAHQRGQAMSLQSAYDKARKMNPEIDQILSQRERAAELKNRPDPLVRARKAASTVSGAPSGGQAPKKKPEGTLSRREILSRAFDDLSEN